MGEQSVRGMRAEKASRNDESDAGNKLADFGRSLFNKGEKLANDIGKKVQNIDTKELAEGAKNIGNKAKDAVSGVDVDSLSKQAQKFGKDFDVNNAAKTAQQVLKGTDLNTVGKIAAGAAGFGFPQLGLLSAGANEVGDYVARKQAKALVDDPKALADKLTISFDELDRKKTGFLDDAALRSNSDLKGLGSDLRPVSAILRSGFTSFNSLDGDASKQGISRKDIETFGLLQDKDLLSKQIDKQAMSDALKWSVGGAGIGLAGSYLTNAGLKFSIDALKSLPIARTALFVVGGAAIGGIAGNLISKNQQENFYEVKKDEMDRLLKAMKSQL
ncbi:MAG: hypothetical protein K2X77_04315 [Candidatus Obscuribacterales bacterium]|jgi:hypothetical protein|nr:hypothetical protein [Candidatus Obscuribacterales bacterium]